MKFGEANCRKLKVGGYSWSLTLQAARDKIRYFKLCISKRKKRNIGARLLCKLSKKVNINAEYYTLAKLENELHLAFQEYKKVRKDAKELRKGFINDLAKRLEKRGKGKRAKIVRQLIETEEQRSMFRKLAFIHGKSTDLGTS